MGKGTEIPKHEGSLSDPGPDPQSSWHKGYYCLRYLNCWPAESHDPALLPTLPPHMCVSQDFLSPDMGRATVHRPKADTSCYVPASCISPHLHPLSHSCWFPYSMAGLWWRQEEAGASGLLGEGGRGRVHRIK